MEVHLACSALEVIPETMSLKEEQVVVEAQMWDVTHWILCIFSTSSWIEVNTAVLVVPAGAEDHNLEQTEDP